MSQQYRITKDQIFQATNGGLDIIRHYISDIDDYIGKSKKFAIRDEKTPSCAVKQLSDGNYVVADFGADGKWMNGIVLTQKFENCEYGEAIKIVAERHGLASSDEIKSMYEPEKSSEDAAPDQNDGEWYFNHAEDINESHLEIIFSKHTWSYVEYQYRSRPEAERKEAVAAHFKAILKEQHWHVLESYTIIKNRKAITFKATEFYPIFRIEEVTDKDRRFSKVYQPKAKDKSRRFFYHGAFDAQFLHGYQQVKRAYEELLKQAPEDKGDEESDQKKENQKLEEVIYCTGGSDALNFRALGYHVIYPSSEHFKLTKDQLFQLNLKTNNVMTCPDLDYTGQLQNHRLCMTHDSEHYLDIRTIDLPEALKNKRDQYGRPCKDLRDFLKHYKASDLRNQVKVAMMYRFWDYQISFDRSGKVKMRYGRPLYEYKLSIERVLNFLVKNGFGRRRVSEETMEFIQIDGNLVRQIRPEDIKTYLLNFLRSRFVSEDLLNVVHRSTSLSANSFDSLPVLAPDFKDFDIDAQYLFFKNISWKISAKGIEQIDSSKVDKMVWEKRIVPHEVKLLPKMFEATVNEFGRYNLIIHNQSCLFFKFLIQISRTHWRTELESNLDGLSPQEVEAYKTDNKFNIAGPNLSDDEQHEQVEHLLNKLYLFGYMVHRYKDDSRPWVPYVMDDTPNRDGLSHGRSGKSIFIKGLRALRNLLVFDGKNPKLLDDPHALEQINVNTDVVLVDDVIDSFPMERTFTMTTSDWNINPKGKTKFSIPFDEAPKLAITTNFAPKNRDQSTMGRVFFAGASNYYHIDTGEGVFRETRQPVDEFGKLLFREQYTKEEWNNSLNFMAQCCQFYLGWTGKPITAPMSNIMDRSLTNTIGLNFLAWAEVFFSEESGRLNCFVSSQYAREEYEIETGIKTLSPNGFNSKIKIYAQLKSITLNPKETQNAEGRVLKNWFDLSYDKRERKWIKYETRKTQSMFYFQKLEGLSDRIYDPTLSPDDLPQPKEGTEKPNF